MVAQSGNVVALVAQSMDGVRTISAHDTMRAAAKVLTRAREVEMSNNSDQLAPQVELDPSRMASMNTVARFWGLASAELVPIREDLATLYRSAGAAGIMEQRALALGVMAEYLESLMAKQPSQIVILGALYGRLVESERRAYEAFRKHRKTKDANPDLASLA